MRTEVPSRPRILVVEDEVIIARDIRLTLESLGYLVTSIVHAGEEAIEVAGRQRPDLVMMDIMLQGALDGIDAARQIQSGLSIPVVYLTAHSDEKMLERAKTTQPFGYLIKPFNDRDLRSVIETALYKHAMERRLREKEEWLSTVLNSIGEAVIASDREGLIDFMNPTAQSLTGWTETQARGRPVGEVFAAVDGEPGGAAGAASATNAAGTGRTSFEAVIRSRAGGTLPVSCTLTPLTDRHGGVGGSVLVFRDETRRRELEQRLLAQSITDELTGLYNRRGFFTMAQQQIRQAARSRQPLDLLFIDLDGLKAINDTHGHTVGDQVLSEFAAILTGTVRESDIVGRIGGDEFTVLAIGLDEDGRDSLTSRLARRVDEFNARGGRPYRLGYSIGTAACDPLSPEDIDGLISRADGNMYEAKRRKSVL